MAKPIDRRTYERVEWNLHREKQHRATIALHKDDVLHGSAGTDWRKPSGGSTGRTSDPVSAQAMQLVQPPRRVQRAQAWLDTSAEVRQWFDSSPEGRLFDLYYGRGVSIAMVAAALGTNRRGVERWRDNVVYRCAMIAASKGLIRI